MTDPFRAKEHELKEPVELLPCPFCGGEAEAMVSHWNIVGTIQCLGCSVQVSALTWNKRAELEKGRFELVQVHEANGFAEVVIRSRGEKLVYAGNINKMEYPENYYPPAAQDELEKEQ